ncbi:variant erythrocyte surface antigen-1 family protein [Babesia caballi]|uniref:Variant erythrocyte surface antigen-1 family protein n=1 Tax=Babesia caballi TaxID=5871 RepID=A0AAV4LU73_BABCB|nr:variant erythrocyte surface antigen-1 family protein [Babesia caballi]
MSGSGNKLTDPPKNLKEAIDWVLRVSGRDNGHNEAEGIKGLAKELITLLDKDAGEVARGVLGVMGVNLKKVVGDLKNLDNPTAFFSTFVLRGLIDKVSKSLQKVTDYGSAAGTAYLEMLRELLQKDVAGKGHGPIRKFAEGLKTFIGWNGNAVGQDGLGKQDYKSAYKSEATWPTQSGEKETCAYIFIAILPLVFYFLPYLYAKCNENGDWNGFNLSTGNLKNFMESEALGFKGQFETAKNGSDVATLIGGTCFPEIKSAYESVNPTYGFFIDHYERRSRVLYPINSDSPLLECFAIASPFFTPKDTYDVQSTNPATPSFTGYSGLTALGGGAYGFNLGGLGTFVSALLA